MAAHLEVQSPGGPTLVPLENERTTIGAAATNDVVISWDLTVSRVHAVMERIGEAGWVVRDLSSRNGTFVNGERLWRDMAEVDTSGAGAHANWPDQFFARIVGGYLTASSNHGGRVGDAYCYLLSARGLLDFALPVMKRVASDREEFNGHFYALAVQSLTPCHSTILG